MLFYILDRKSKKSKLRTEIGRSLSWSKIYYLVVIYILLDKSLINLKMMTLFYGAFVSFQII